MTTATRQFTTSGRPAADRFEDPDIERPDTRRRRPTTGPIGDPRRAARGLGWFSIGLGLAECAAPRRMARLIGVEDDDRNRNTLFAYGVREIASGLGILLGDRPAVPVWARVGGDVMDLAFLGNALRSDESETGRVAAATAAVLGVLVLDVLTGRSLATEHRTGADGGDGVDARRPGVQVRQQITVNRPPEEVYRFWRDFENLPRFMEHLESVRVHDDRRSRWTARAPAGTSVEWDAEITEDRPNERIAWRSVTDADVPNSGAVRFTPAPGGRGTEVHVELRYDPPGGKLGALIAKLFGEEPGSRSMATCAGSSRCSRPARSCAPTPASTAGSHPAQPSAPAPRRGGADR